MTIPSWSEADRPREKMMLKGKQALSDAELLAILIGSGSVGESAVALAQRILRDRAHNLHELGKCTLKDLEKYRGIGEAKAVTIAAALELGRRRQLSDLRERPKITCSRDIFAEIGPLLRDLPVEEFWILLLNRANELLGRRRLSEGGTAGTVVDVKLVFRAALEEKAIKIVAVHNHPSGNLTPSEPDKKLTQQLKMAGEALDIPLLDHLIVSERGYFSFADEGLL